MKNSFVSIRDPLTLSCAAFRQALNSEGSLSDQVRYDIYENWNILHSKHLDLICKDIKEKFAENNTVRPNENWLDIYEKWEYECNGSRGKVWHDHLIDQMYTVDKKIKIHIDTLANFAFNYSIGRRSGIVSTVVTDICWNWDFLTDGHQREMFERIVKENNEHNLGDDCDHILWMKIVKIYYRKMASQFSLKESEIEDIANKCIWDMTDIYKLEVVI